MWRDPIVEEIRRNRQVYAAKFQHDIKAICRAAREKTMKRDPIVEEIHQTRQKLLEECGGDLNQLMERYKAVEIQDRSRLVSTISVRKNLCREGERKGAQHGQDSDS